MKTINRISCFLLILFIGISCNGCLGQKTKNEKVVEDEYYKFRINFEKRFLDITSLLDFNNISESIEHLKSKENKKKIENIKVLLDGIQSKVPIRMKGDYKTLKDCYDNLNSITKTAKKWEDMSFKEQDKCFREFGAIEILKDQITEEG